MEAKIYTPFFDEIKNKIRAAQYAAMREVNIQLIQLYWEIGRSISEKQKLGWGKSIVESLSVYLKREFPQTKGFSSTNLWLMTQFYQSYCDEVNLQPLVGEISWSKHAVILAKIKDRELRRYYITSTRNLNWTKAQLIREIENETHLKILNSQNSFLDHSKEKLITLKDKYLFDFLELDINHSERDLEKGLLNNVQKFLLEMGNQFSFIGSQFKIQLEGNEYFRAAIPLGSQVIPLQKNCQRNLALSFQHLKPLRNLLVNSGVTLTLGDQFFESIALRSIVPITP